MLCSRSRGERGDCLLILRSDEAGAVFANKNDET